MAEATEPEKTEQGGEGQDKVEKQFNAAYSKLVALLGGERNMRKSKVPKDNIGKIVDELVAEKRDAAVKAFKEQAVQLLDKKVEFEKEVKKIEEECKNKVNAKRKEFTEEMQKLFKLVDGIEQIEKSYYETLKQESTTKV